jgi:hypothetical protein
MDDLFYQDNDDSEALMQGAELEEIVHIIDTPTLQDPEDSSEKKFEDAPHQDQTATDESDTAPSSTVISQGIT